MFQQVDNFEFTNTAQLFRYHLWFNGGPLNDHLETGRPKDVCSNMGFADHYKFMKETRDLLKSHSKSSSPYHPRYLEFMVHEATVILTKAQNDSTLLVNDMPGFDDTSQHIRYYFWMGDSPIEVLECTGFEPLAIALGYTGLNHFVRQSRKQMKKDSKPNSDLRQAYLDFMVYEATVVLEKAEAIRSLQLYFRKGPTCE
jgi:hypothetical protein